jgi:hypothetical protein
MYRESEAQQVHGIKTHWITNDAHTDTTSFVSGTEHCGTEALSARIL